MTLDVAREIKRLLLSGADLRRPRLGPGDVAVLAARRAELQAVQEALAELGVPAVISSGGTVFHTPAATEWLTLLEAIEQPHRTDRVRAAALTSFFGVSAAGLDRGGDVETDRLADRVRTLADVFAARGVAAVLEATVVDGLTARVLARVGGERTLTDLRHIGEALHKVSVDERLGIVGLLAWLRAQVADEQVEVASERTRRLDSDAAAVQLVTIHGSKGLQYPIVYAPTLWNRYTGNDPEVPLFHDAEGRRARDVGGASPWRGDHVARHRREDAGESLRLLYVALTRAQSQVVAWYAPAALNTPASPLHRLLFGRRPGMAAVPDEQAVVADDRVLEILGHWQAAGGPEPEPADSPPPDADPDRAFRPTTSRRGASPAPSTPRGAARPTPPSPPPPPPRTAPTGPCPSPRRSPSSRTTTTSACSTSSPRPTIRTSPSPPCPHRWPRCPVGATFGSLVHAVLEHADPGAADFRAEVLAHIAEQRVWWPVDLDAEELADALVAVCTQPAGPPRGRGHAARRRVRGPAHRARLRAAARGR